jgi:hypothetical protein
VDRYLNFHSHLLEKGGLLIKSQREFVDSREIQRTTISAVALKAFLMVVMKVAIEQEVW